MSNFVVQGSVVKVNNRQITQGKMAGQYQFFIDVQDDYGNVVTVSSAGKKAEPSGKDDSGQWAPLTLGAYISAQYTQNGQYNNSKASWITILTAGSAPAPQQAAPQQRAPQQAPAQQQRAAAPAGGKVHGATVGMAINNAVAAFIGGVINEGDIPSFSSRLIRLSSALESGRVFEQSKGDDHVPTQPAPSQPPQSPPPPQQPATQQAPQAQPQAQAPADDGWDDDIPF